MLTDKELEEMQVLVDNASPGPWFFDEEFCSVYTSLGEPRLSIFTTTQKLPNCENLKFIAVSRVLVPRLLEEVKEIRESNRLMERLWKDEIKKNVEILKAKDVGYSERNKLVSFLARLYPAHIKQHPAEDKDWESDWKNIVCIHSPTGQMTWHIHDSEAENFGFLNIKPDPFKDCVWDRHTTEEKYLRLGQLPPAQKENEDASLF